MSATVSARQAATLCNVSLTSVQRWIAAGKLPASMVDGAYQISVADLEPFQRRRRATVSPLASATVSADTPPDTVQRVALGDTVAPPNDPGLADLARLVREQAERLEKYAGLVGFYQARIAALEGEVLALKAAPPASMSYGSTEVEDGPHSSVQQATSGAISPDVDDPSGGSSQRPLERENSPVAGEMTHTPPGQQNEAERHPWWRFWKRGAVTA